MGSVWLNTQKIRQALERRIYLIRGQKVMLDADLAALYQVPTKRLNEAVKRNAGRFPEDFMFQVTEEEAKVLMRSQIATSSNLLNQEVTDMRSQSATASKRNVRFLHYAFTEHGVAMLSSVLHSERAVQMNILIVRAFVKIRELLASNKELAARVEKLEAGHKQHGRAISLIVREIDELKSLPDPRTKRIM